MLNRKLLYIIFGIVISTAVVITLVSIVRANDKTFLPLVSNSGQNTSNSTIEPSNLYYIVPENARKPTPTPTPSGSENPPPSESENPDPIAASPVRGLYSEVVDMASKVPITEKALLAFNDGSGGLKAVLVTPDMINAVVNQIGKELLVNLVPPESAFANRVPRVEVPVGTPQVYEKTPGEVPNLPLSTPNPPTQ